jgi:hypothetical protein
MVDALGGVSVDSPLAFTTEEGGVRVHKGENRFTGEEALAFAVTRRFGAAVGPEDFIRSANHQALLLGLVERLQERAESKGFVESMAVAALSGLQTDASPVDLYRLLNALMSIDTSRTQGCVLVGSEAQDASGNQIIVPDERLARRLGHEAVGDATFESGCRPT